LPWNKCPRLWLEITRPGRSRRFKQQSKLQEQFVSALTLAELLARHNGGSAVFCGRTDEFGEVSEETSA
jgi:hypothetical protein